MKLQIESTGDVKRIFDMVVDKYPDEFSFLAENAVFQFTTRETATYDEDGMEIAATAQRLSNRERDLYGSDFEICVFSEYWETLDDSRKERLIYHELLHCYVEPDPDAEGYPKFDRDDRVVIGMIPHDLIVKTFKSEIEQFGLQEGDLKTAEFFHKEYEKYLKGRKRT